MSEKWEIGIDMLQDRLEHVSDYADAEVEAADYVLANAIEAAPCPPGVRAEAYYVPLCHVCGRSLLEGSDVSAWKDIERAKEGLEDSFQKLEDGRKVCIDSGSKCWKWCPCESCDSEEKIIGTDQDTCQDAAGPAGK